MKLTDIDLLDLDAFVNGVPHEWFDVLRREAPVYRHPEAGERGYFWVLTKYDDVVRVGRESDNFSSARGTALFNTPEPEQLANMQLMMLNQDPPKHTKVRNLVNKGFTPRMITKLDPAIRRVAREIVNSVSEKGECDFVTEVAAELPLQVIAELMGIPQEDRHQIFEWSNQMIGSQDPEFAVTQEEATNASMQMYMYANQLAEKRREDPRDDIVTTLLNAEVDGESLSEMEFDVFFLLLAVAGNETTRNLISHGMHALIEFPDQRDRLLDDPSLLPTAVEEMLRWASPVMHFRRTATRDLEIRGQKVEENDKVLIWYISANRDEDQFPNPHVFDVARSPNEQIAFGGGGTHFCLGANLARLEIKILFEEVLQRIPDAQLAGTPSRLRSNFINGLKHLPVKFTPSQLVEAD